MDSLNTPVTAWRGHARRGTSLFEIPNQIQASLFGCLQRHEVITCADGNTGEKQSEQFT